MKSRSEAFFMEATKNLQLAKKELFKPSEDIVTYSICKNSQFAIENFLKGFLTKNGAIIEKNETISTLYNKCLAIDENFKNIEMNAIGCKNHAIDSRYCSEINSVSACFDTADNVDTYLRKIKVL
ncbi:HEPN domain-containing protein [Lutibacter oceani]|uniref:HEPN domain-containing protein n=1 Tax=Lutibacter oceani TaxID=1853311 RepID=A0A3D9RRS2_9FLAO|nr:HEPN domain-containing protein [Lutibacter oceani]REE79856.1 HEPN domain-containing protein [Lutibacter oceani]